MLEADVVDRISSFVQEHGLDEAVVSNLRGTWPKIHFTYCFDDDISGAKPVREFADFNVYLVDGREHCLKFTHDMQAATGLVLAHVEPE